MSTDTILVVAESLDTEGSLLLAQGLETQAWFVDSADVVWAVGEVDSEQIALA